MKKIVCLVFSAVFLALSLCACGVRPDPPAETAGTETDAPSGTASDPQTNEPGTVGPEAAPMLLVLEDNAGTWVLRDASEAPQLYAVTDLDGNGRPEILSCVTEGTGLFTKVRMFEVNAAGDGIESCFYAPSTMSSEPDLGTDFLRYFEKDGQRVYIVNDVMKNGAAEQHAYKYGMTFENGSAGVRLIGYCDMAADGMDVNVRYYDANGAEISAEAYENAEAEAYAGFTEGTVDLGWFDLDGEGSLTDKLTASFDVFRGQ